MLLSEAVNEAEVGRGAAVNDVIAFPSGSDAVTPKDMNAPSAPATVEGAVTTGGLSSVPVVVKLNASWEPRPRHHRARHVHPRPARRDEGDHPGDDRVRARGQPAHDPG